MVVAERGYNSCSGREGIVVVADRGEKSCNGREGIVVVAERGGNSCRGREGFKHQPSDEQTTISYLIRKRNSIMVINTFMVAAGKMWNQLLTVIKCSGNVNIFKKNLKNRLFNQTLD